MERKMIFVKDWSTLPQGLTTMVRRFEKPFYEPCFEALIRYESLPLRILSRKFSFSQLRLFKSSHPVSLSDWKQNIFSKVFKLCKLIAIVTDKHQFAHAVYHPPAILLATEVNATHIYSSKSWHTFVHAGAHLRKPHAGAHLRKP